MLQGKKQSCNWSINKAWLAKLRSIATLMLPFKIENYSLLFVNAV